MRMQKRGRAWALALATLAAAMAGPTPGQAQSGAETPVVVELFTSQGCNSCPPADALLGELTAEPGVIGLTYNVDYWNYLGWRDRFSKPAHTERQRAYASSLGASSIYTPQMVVQGAYGLVGSRRGVVRAAIAGQRRAPAPAKVALTSEGARLTIAVSAEAAFAAPAEIWLVGYTGPHSEAIGAGENHGRTITYHNVARALTRIGDWDGAAPARFSAARDPAMKGYVAIVQAAGVGRILGAADFEAAPAAAGG